MLLYKYTSVSEYSIDNLIKHQLYCNPYHAFNDPFECWFTWSAAKPHPDREPDRFRSVLATWGVELDDCDLEMYHEYLNSLTEGLARDVEGGRDGARITCLCNGQDNLLMWSHYADGMRGFCIEFDAEELLSLRKETAQLMQVRYASKPAFFDAAVWAVALDQAERHEGQIAEVSSITPEDPWLPKYADWAQASRARLRDMYATMFATKPMQWSYEQEYRIVFGVEEVDTAKTFLPYPEEAIKSVIIGDKMPDADRERLLAAIRESSPGAGLKAAGRSKNSFELSITQWE